MFIHGLFMNGWDLSLLRHRVTDAGFATYQFSYHSTSQAIEATVQEIHDFVSSINADEIHYVCHSLGGLVVRHFFHAFQDLPPGRVVTLGTPHQGSGVARFFNQHRIGMMLLGESINAGLLGNAPPWDGQRELGSIAGISSFGMGMIFQDMHEPNDGTVTVSETRLENATAHLELPVTHTGLVVSAIVAEEVIHFLKHGYFTATVDQVSME